MDDRRTLMVTAGLAQLAASGVSLGLETVSLRDAAREVGLQPEDAERLWSVGGRSAEDQFRESVAIRLLSQPPFPGADGEGRSPALQDALIELARVLEEMPDMIELDPRERGWWARRLFHAGTSANIDAAGRSLLWQSYLAVAAAAQSTAAAPSIVEGWHAASGPPATRFINAYAVLAERFGMRLRYCYSWDQFAAAVAIVGEGYLLRPNTDVAVRTVERATGKRGDLERWTLFAVCVEALVRQFFEPDGSAISTDLDHESPPE